MAATERSDDPKQDALRCRALGAPVVFVCSPDVLQWWKPHGNDAELLQTVKAASVPEFFLSQGERLNPRRVYEGKTRGRVQTDYQLHFVDAGLMPLVEQETGERLSQVVARVITQMLDHVVGRQKTPSETQMQNVFRSAFWLLAAKILRDKSVPSFKTVELVDPNDVFDRIARHYGGRSKPPPSGGPWKHAVAGAADAISQFAHLGNVSTEALSYVYENTLVTKALRRELGIHSTPSYLVDYMVWQLAPWIEEIRPENRIVFEPACGHGAFLVSAMRLLREIEAGEDLDRRRCSFRRRLIGVDVDPFALEIARLSLTLADVPNRNGWQLLQEDVFDSDVLSDKSKQAGILLVNPPFENFPSGDRDKYAKAGRPVAHRNKTAELLRRTLGALPTAAVVGAVVPQGFLHNRDATKVRRLLLDQFDLAEICLFPDKVFTFSDMESAILLGRKGRKHVSRFGTFRHRRVREKDADDFKERYAVSEEGRVERAKLGADPGWSMRIPSLANLWECCKGLPKLGELASIQQGLVYRGRDLPSKAITLSEKPSRGLVAGFSTLSGNLQIHLLPPRVHMNLDPSVIRRPGAGTTTGVPQVLLNYAPVSRGPWRLKAVIDRRGHAITSNYLAVRPRDRATPLESLWAICNSPVANAFTYSHSLKRHVLAGQLRRMPCPRVFETDVARVAESAKGYLAAVRDTEAPFAPEAKRANLRGLLMEMDAQVLRLYDLPPRIERQLLDLFAGHQRPGVPFAFERYYPADYTPWVPLHVYLSEGYQRSTARELRRRWKPIESGALRTALARAADASSED